MRRVAKRLGTILDHFWGQLKGEPKARGGTVSQRTVVLQVTDCQPNCMKILASDGNIYSAARNGHRIRNLSKLSCEMWKNDHTSDKSHIIVHFSDVPLAIRKAFCSHFDSFKPPKRAHRLIQRERTSATVLLQFIETALGNFRTRSSGRGPESAFLAGAALAFRVCTEIDVPWSARTAVAEAGETLGRRAMRENDRKPNSHYVRLNGSVGHRP